MSYFGKRQDISKRNQLIGILAALIRLRRLDNVGGKLLKLEYIHFNSGCISANFGLNRSFR